MVSTTLKIAHHPAGCTLGDEDVLCRPSAPGSDSLIANHASCVIRRQLTGGCGPCAVSFNTLTAMLVGRLFRPLPLRPLRHRESILSTAEYALGERKRRRRKNIQLNQPYALQALKPFVRAPVMSPMRKKSRRCPVCYRSASSLSCRRGTHITPTSCPCVGEDAASRTNRL